MKLKKKLITHSNSSFVILSINWRTNIGGFMIDNLKQTTLYDVVFIHIWMAPFLIIACLFNPGISSQHTTCFYTALRDFTLKEWMTFNFDHINLSSFSNCVFYFKNIIGHFVSVMSGSWWRSNCQHMKSRFLFLI